MFDFGCNDVQTWVIIKNNVDDSFKNQCDMFVFGRVKYTKEKHM